MKINFKSLEMMVPATVFDMLVEKIEKQIALFNLKTHKNNDSNHLCQQSPSNPLTANYL